MNEVQMLLQALEDEMRNVLKIMDGEICGEQSPAQIPPKLVLVWANKVTSIRTALDKK